MKLPAIYAIINVDSERDPLDSLSRLLSAGAEIVQLRNKTLSRTEFIALSREALRLRNEFRGKEPEKRFCSIIINDDIEVCVEISADGVHLGQEDSRPETARETLGQQSIIGLSTHSLEQVLSAPREVLSYLALGPIFPSSTKSGHAAEIGLEGLRAIRPHVSLPLVAIGGIDQKNAQSVFAAGADSLAMISALQKDPALVSLRPNLS